MEREPSQGENITKLQLDHAKGIASYERGQLNRPAFDGVTDQYGEVRLKLAIVDNPEIIRTPSDTVDPVDPTNIINLNTGTVTLRWIGLPGGIIRPAGTKDGGTSGVYKNEPKENQIDPRTRDWTNWKIESRREQVELASPFIWSDGFSWCGFHHIPPVGSIVVVGFKKHGLPVILGYLNGHYKITKPVLRPGEICMKGYGKNHIHWRDSNKLDIMCWSDPGDIDLDAKNAGMTKDPCPLVSEMWIGLNANDQRIDIKASQTDGETIYSQATFTPKDVTVITTDGGGFSKFYQNSSLQQFDTKTFRVNADLVDINAAKITQN